MALTGVLRPGYVQIRVMEMEPALRHYRDLVGLNVVSTESDGRVYLKTFDEFDRHSIILREADEPGMDFMGFKVDSTETLHMFKQKIEDYGISTETIAAGDQPGLGERVRFVAPTGHNFELYADIEASDNGPMTENPDIWEKPPQSLIFINSFDQKISTPNSSREDIKCFCKSPSLTMKPKLFSPISCAENSTFPVPSRSQA